MDELMELRELVENQDYKKALLLIDELEEMSREDKLAKIYSHAVVLLVHLIKQAAEERTTRSWDFSIYNSIKSIKRINQRRKAGGFYANTEQLNEILNDAFDIALRKSALEAFGGIYTEMQLLEKINPIELQQQALDLISGS
ncbi:DUF29 family protein [Thermosynechococcaceae cyanobacterium BACA0444]|uniref:DUF29 family protein n=1 Tax=Pseudocalidococcus azoricus BACA0444 TaxID=2918990 RepID=A0AAE4JYY7_9CYAN|nr:DUF29 family protein [Pseudocalidococcus azoricus]MDS3861524.1 DUF29 family protein [Pseudocalidococcus azoricus BACA0444]